jgi:hypothetical protein
MAPAPRMGMESTTVTPNRIWPIRLAVTIPNTNNRTLRKLDHSFEAQSIEGKL